MQNSPQREFLYCMFMQGEKPVLTIEAAARSRAVPSNAGSAASSEVPLGLQKHSSIGTFHMM